MNSTSNQLCPSSSCQKGATLLGVVQNDKTVTLLNMPLTIDKAFVDKTKEAGSPEKRFRFANKCVKNGCKQWTGSACGVIDLLAKINTNIEENDAPLKPCMIRDRCRWFKQEGKKACTICTFVVTNNMEESLS